MSQKSIMLLFSVFTVLFIAGCGSQTSEFKIENEKYTLENGMEVILHDDKSDPIVSVAVLYHVGSNREVKGRTGFAHLFEHMMFQESQHVGQDQFFQKIQNAGGTLNGGTWKDGTVYYQVVPNNALEMVLWMESDRMGFLLSTVTQEAFINQQEVVQNEKRQRYDNQPYGHTSYVIDKLIYPENHPYNWQVIGEFVDLKNATLSDIHEFYRTWYGPNNATLVIAGDFDKEETKKLVEKYFGELTAEKKVESLNPMPVIIEETKRAYHEDNFAPSPELNMVFPTVQQFTKDAYALDILGELFSEGKKAPLYKVIVEEKKLAPSVSGYQASDEIAGVFRIRIRAFPDKNLSEVEDAIAEAFKKFEDDGFTEKDLDRVKAKVETNFYNGISSILGKSFQLAYYNEFAGSPEFITKDLQQTLDVTKKDVMRVFEKYIKDKPYALTSFVPKGKPELLAQDSEKFAVVEEKIEEQDAIGLQEGEEIAGEQVIVERIGSSFDRTIEPPLGPDPLLSIPTVWNDELANGINVYGIEHSELPLVNFSLTIKGGMLCDDIDKIGVANLMTDIMMQGTKNKTPIELEEAIDELGASITMYTNKEAIVIQANCLSSRFNQTYNLVEEILFEPRWDETEFERVKNETIEAINRNNSNPTIVASNVFSKILYGEENILCNSTFGTISSVETISVDDLKNFYAANYSPDVTSIAIVGDISEKDAVAAFKSLELRWERKEVEFKDYPFPPSPEKPALYFVDFPDAKQSVIRIGNLSLAYTDENYYPVQVMNYKLGGNFNSYVNMILREEKGFTYGARTKFSGTLYPGYFSASSSVRSNATFESAQIFIDQMNKYREGIREDDLEFTKNALIKSNARRFETLGALRGMLNNIATYNLPIDYVKKYEEIVRNMTLEDHKKLANEYIDPNVMTYVIVGDAKTQLEQLKDLGVGKPILVDREGNPVN